MKPSLDFSTLVSGDELPGEDERETTELREMLSEAREFLESFCWCQSVEEVYLGLGVGGVVGVFLFKILPASDDVDTWLWVVTGDVPPAYISTVHAQDPGTALEGYIYEMTKWVEAVRAGGSVDEIIPVNVAPTLEHAHALDNRLKLLQQEILPKYRARRLSPIRKN
jgi:hypothetical protein